MYESTVPSGIPALAPANKVLVHPTFLVLALVHRLASSTMEINRSLSKKHSSGTGSRAATARAKTGHRRPSHRMSTVGRRRESRLPVPETNDLEEIEQEMAAVEARIQEIMQNLQTDIVNAANYMTDSISMWSGSVLDETRHSLNALQALRDSNQKTTALSQRIHDV